MKEKLGIKGSLFVFRSMVSPFGTTIFRPFKGVSVEVENVVDEKAPDNGIAAVDEYGRVVVPSGGSARVYVKEGETDNQLRIEDYRDRTRHTLGAKITGEGVDVDLNLEERKKLIPGIGHIKYYND